MRDTHTATASATVAAAATTATVAATAAAAATPAARGDAPPATAAATPDSCYACDRQPAHRLGSQSATAIGAGAALSAIRRDFVSARVEGDVRLRPSKKVSVRLGGTGKHSSQQD